MKRLTRSIVSIVGEFPYLVYLDFRKKYFANKSQRLELQKEKEEFTRSMEFFSAFIKPGDLCFDVGANMGKRVETFLKLGARVVAIEPQSICAKYLRWKFKNKIQVVETGLGEFEEERILYISPFKMTSTFSVEFMKERLEKATTEIEKKYIFFWNSSTKIKLTPIEKLINTYGTPDFLKIDVEGYEFEVLKGLKKTIPKLSFEYHLPLKNENTIKCIDALHKLNKNYQYNFSPSETMELSLKRWRKKDEFINELGNYDLVYKNLKDDFGDIYVIDPNKE